MARFFKPKQTKKTIDTKHQSFTVSKLDHQGDGIAFHNNKAVFIPEALPNETVLAQLIEDKKNYSKAKLIKILEPNPNRVLPFCPHYQQCGGCNLQHLSHQEQIKQKQQTLNEMMRKFTQHSSIKQSESIVDEPTQYRRRARLSINIGKEGMLHIGFRKKASKDIIDIHQCPVLESKLNDLLPEIRNLLTHLRAKKILGHIEIVQANNALVILIRAIKHLHPEDIYSIEQFASKHCLTLFLKQADDESKLILGDMPFYQLENLKLCFEPHNFIQINQKINLKMVKQAIEWLDIKNTDHVLDLFCGIGNFSLPISTHAKTVVGIEGVESMVEQAKNNAKLNHLDNLNFYHADLESDFSNTAWGKQKYQKILLDPARAGASGVISYLVKSQAQRIVYVSCNPATLARDTAMLLEKNYKLERFGLLDMFPNTGHLESMALFIRA